MQSPRGRPRRVTLRDIAEAAGVHFTTVGMALRGSSELPETTRKRIREIADRLGYKPDPMLSALNAYRIAGEKPNFQAAIAWINNWPTRKGLLENDTFKSYYDGACARAKELGYAVEEFWLCEKGMTPARLTSILQARNIEAILLAPQPKPNMFPKLDYSKFAVIAFGYSLQPSIFNVVTNHHFHSMNLVLRQVQALGYKRVGLFVEKDWDEKVEHAWIAGLTLAHWLNPQLENVPPLLEEKAADARQLRSWLASYKPDIILSHSVVEKKLRDLGYRVPEDIGFVSLHLKEGQQDLSGIYQNDRRIGMAAVDYIVSMLHSGQRGIPDVPTCILIESEWNPGRTVGRPIP